MKGGELCLWDCNIWVESIGYNIAAEWDNF